jgi:hypothetical protein
MAKPRVELVIRWLLGLWATGLGFRFFLELLLADQFIILPNYLVNIYFDFLPLFIFGSLVAFFETRRLIHNIGDKEILKDRGEI